MKKYAWLKQINCFQLIDVNECDQSPCHDNATCVNEIGSFECSCLEGFTGNGSQCLG